MIFLRVQSSTCETFNFRKGDVAIWVRMTLSAKWNSNLLSSCQVIMLIARMTFNSSPSCLMSTESMEITINTSRCYEHGKQWNDNSHILPSDTFSCHYLIMSQEQFSDFSSIVTTVYIRVYFYSIISSTLYSNVYAQITTRIN